MIILKLKNFIHRLWFIMSNKSYWKRHTFIGILIIIILAIVVVWVLKAPILSSYLSSKLKVPISISSMDVSKSRMKIRNFSIKNPWGYNSKYAFYTQSIDAKYDWLKLMDSPSQIELIQINHAYLNIDCSNMLCTKNNWSKIVDKMQKKKTKTSDKEVIVRRLELNDLTVTIHGMGLDSNSSTTSHFNSFVFTDVSSKTGFPTDELIYEIFKSAGIKKYIEDILKLQKHVQKMIQPFFSENKKILRKKYH